MNVIVAELLLGESDAMRRLRALIVKVAPTSLPILIEGPTGSGKELVARALHAASARRGQFVAFNVCAIADTMFEDALFGHVRGAFTGAMNDSSGYLKQAHEGTAFFDEVCGLSMGSQAKLLRAIETGEFRPVGANRDVRSEFRVVAATNQNLGSLQARGEFREDLLHRFGKMIVRIPRLADRRDDVPLLASHFWSALGRVGDGGITAPAMRMLQEHEWPGNVRELRAVIEAAAVLAPDGRIDACDVAPLLSGEGQKRLTVQLDFEIRRTLEVLEEVRGDAIAAADQLGIHKSTVYRRIRRAQASGANTSFVTSSILPPLQRVARTADA